MGTARDLVVGSEVWPACNCSVSNFCCQSSDMVGVVWVVEERGEVDVRGGGWNLLRPENKSGLYAQDETQPSGQRQLSMRCTLITRMRESATRKISSKTRRNWGSKESSFPRSPELTSLIRHHDFYWFLMACCCLLRSDSPSSKVRQKTSWNVLWCRVCRLSGAA